MTGLARRGNQRGAGKVLAYGELSLSINNAMNGGRGAHLWEGWDVGVSETGGGV
ncbi:Uncharacterised protein [Mycobacteroides abscessus subsp. abscessus]|nr:Uncharacterised protein [Mycobacteroides abscessus subsp. abscessus]SHX37671.1 Uncharacterised protein [Mycobacteroides abscessus subsp. abscessus]SIA58045.1 Uncharacterised protein [Mycobacteroides abscessus subsp. abscessus]SIA65376.1 Uncharacterised protein [Mycobacteroides abscessus subsp. abscessus]SIB58019.1 Uncharacterised protein [Mycobacteroides abscessus subsp. abscessus]